MLSYRKIVAQGNECYRHEKKCLNVLFMKAPFIWDVKNLQKLVACFLSKTSKSAIYFVYIFCLLLETSKVFHRYQVCFTQEILYFKKYKNFFIYVHWHEVNKMEYENVYREGIMQYLHAGKIKKPSNFCNFISYKN